MPTTIIYGDQSSQVEDAEAEGDDLWLSLEELRRATGWELRPEGACKDDLCVPIPPEREPEFLRQDGRRLNLAALARLRGEPLVRDQERAVWLFGEPAGSRREALLSLEAPDFRLPDLEGREHSLSDYRGTKVFLVSWASW